MSCVGSVLSILTLDIDKRAGEFLKRISEIVQVLQVEDANADPGRNFWSDVKWASDRRYGDMIIPAKSAQ